jgi:hypothetical protein
MGIEPSSRIVNTQVVDFNHTALGEIWENLNPIGGSCIKLSNFSRWEPWRTR